jgi:hypothetical protein
MQMTQGIRNLQSEIETATNMCASQNSEPGVLPSDIKSLRGRKRSNSPSSLHLKILGAAKNQTYGEIAAIHGVSRQRIGQIVQRWKQYLPVRTLRPKNNVIRDHAQRPPVKKENRVHVVSFRLTDAEFQMLQLRYPEMKSADRAARGIVTRFLSF